MVCVQLFLIREIVKNTKVKFQRVQVPYAQESNPEALASGKLVWGDPCSEGSQTAKVCTDEQVGLANIPQYYQFGAYEAYLLG